MEDNNNFKYYQEKVSKTNKTFKSEDKTVAKGVFGKGAKQVKQYVDAFGTSQNEFNSNVSRAFEEGSSMLEAFEEKVNVLETKLASLVQQNEALKTRINALQRADLMVVDSCIKSTTENARLVDGYVRRLDPELRNGYVPASCRDVDFHALAQAFQLPKGGDADGFNFETFGKSYKEALKGELKKAETRVSNRMVGVVCTGFLNPNGVSPDVYEAVQVYRLLRRSSVYEAKFISIETALERPVVDGDLLCIPAKDCGRYLGVLGLKACVVCAETLDFFAIDSALASLRSLVVLTSQNPVGGVSEELLQELVYANDFGVQRYTVQSKGASDALTAKGFHEPTVSYPMVNTSKLHRVRRKVYTPDSYTVGVVSPLDPNEAGGTALLEETVKGRPDYAFKVVWSSKGEVPSGLSEAKNCTVVRDANLDGFYAGIDCLLVPYATTEGCAVPVSALEAMLLGIPVVCTDVSGVSELVERSVLGEVASADATDLGRALDRVYAYGGAYETPLGYEAIREAIDYSSLVDSVERSAETTYPKGYVPLRTWKETLSKAGKSLTVGEGATVRGSKVEPGDSVSRIVRYVELQNLALVLEDRYDGNRKLSILDVSYDHGRVSEACKEYGECTVSDTFLSETVEGTFDVVTCFDYLPRLEYSIRKRLYERARGCLKDYGTLVVNVPNLHYDLTYKHSKGWQNYDAYGVSWTKEDFVEELKQNGFKVQYVVPVGQGLDAQAPDGVKGVPASWTVGAVKG